MMLFVFWISLFAIFYAYIGYPLVLLLISRFWKRDALNVLSDELPRVSLMISAYNEEKVVGDKMENSLSLDYPKELLEIVVISDGCDDRTEEIVKRYTDRGVVLRSYPERIGKTACLNKAVPQAKGVIIIFSDANSKYDRNAIRELVKHFSDERMGFVTGHTRYMSETDREKILPIGIYSRIETLTKKLESEISSCVGADGAIFAIRKNLFQPLDNLDINDLIIPFQIIQQGYRGIFDGRAYCVEQPSGSLGLEFKRQMRIANRTLRAIHKYRELMNPLKMGLFSFQLVSHKLCKLLVPFALLSLFVADVVLISANPFYIVSLLSQIGFYLIPWLVKSCGWFSVCRSFIMVNLAMLYGWIQWAMGKRYETWETVR